MTISLLWLNDYLKTDLTPGQLADALTSIGLEVEKTETWDSIMGGLSGIIAGHVLTCERHPDADRLTLTTVDVGRETPASIVCGASNIAAGQKVWVALPGTTLYDAHGKPWTINISKIRGATSEGMICAEDELGLGKGHDGIMILPDAVQVGAKASEYYKVTTDTIFEIGLTPNRSDATSILGVAEDLAAYLTVQSNKLHIVKWPVINSLPDAQHSVDFKVSVRNTEACPRYSGIVISGIQIGPSPDWLQQRLQSIGVKTINNVVDITNFVLHEMGQPLHAFDAEKISGKEIIVETKSSGTPFLALDGLTYNLYHEDLVICDGQGNPMCIGGVYGGLNSGVTNTTKTIFLEAAHFNAGWVRRTSMRHNLRTEAARRFEKGSDPTITVKALARASQLLTELAGSKIASSIYDIYPSPIQPAKVTLHFATLNAMTGVSFKAEEIMKIVRALNMDVIEKGDHKVVLSIPTNKADVTREIDVIEEILRIYGFTNVPLPGKMNTSVAIESRFAPHKMRRTIGQLLASRGFLEMMNMSLTQPSYYKKIENAERNDWVTIHNTSNESLNLMRPEMIMPTLETVMRNVNRQQDNLRLFEFGSTYKNNSGTPAETEHLVLTMTGKKTSDHWMIGNGKPVDFFSLKTEVNALLTRLGISDLTSSVFEKRDGFEFGIELKSGSTLIVRFGRIAKSLLDQFDITQPVYLADFYFSLLIHLASKAVTLYRELNKFPSVQRDLAIVIDEKISYDEVSRVALIAGRNWLKNTEVFDIYVNPDHIGKGKKSIALRFTIDNKEAMLTDKDIDQWFNKIQKAFIQELQAEIRK